jgi:hypothetical protein
MYLYTYTTGHVCYVCGVPCALTRAEVTVHSSYKGYLQVAAPYIVPRRLQSVLQYCLFYRHVAESVIIAVAR